MNNTVTAKDSETTLTNAQPSKLNWLDSQAKKVEQNIFAYAPMMILVQTCIGSIAAAMIGEQKETLLMFTCVLVSMAANGAFIAQASAKACVVAFLISIAVNFGLIAVFA